MINHFVRVLVPAFAILSGLMTAAPAAAHQETVAFSKMLIRESGDIEFALKIPVEDLAETLGKVGHATMDAPEVRAAEERLFGYFQPLVKVAAGGAACPVQRNGLDVPEDDRLFGEMRFIFRCPPGAAITLDYRVFFDIDPGHVGMLEVEGPGGKARAELIVERPRWQIKTSADGAPQLQFLEGAAAPPESMVQEPTAQPENPDELKHGERLEVGELATEDSPRSSPPRSTRWTFIILFAIAAGLAGLGLRIYSSRRRARS